MEEIFYNEGGETLEQVAQRGRGGPIRRNIQDQIGQDSEQPDPAEDVPAYLGGGWLDGLQRSLATKSILWFYGISVFPFRNGLREIRWTRSNQFIIIKPT